MKQGICIPTVIPLCSSSVLVFTVTCDVKSSSLMSVLMFLTGSGAQRMSGDLVAVWEVALSDGVHRIEFEHGTTTGKRIIYIDGKVRIF